jgi:hypothetical protein
MRNIKSSQVYLKFSAAQIARTIATLFLTIALCFSTPLAFADGKRTSNASDFNGYFSTQTSQGATFLLILGTNGNTVKGEF